VKFGKPVDAKKSQIADNRVFKASLKMHDRRLDSEVNDMQFSQKDTRNAEKDHVPLFHVKERSLRGNRCDGAKPGLGDDRPSRKHSDS